MPKSDPAGTQWIPDNDRGIGRVRGGTSDGTVDARGRHRRGSRWPGGPVDRSALVAEEVPGVRGASSKDPQAGEPSTDALGRLDVPRVRNGAGSQGPAGKGMTP